MMKEVATDILEELYYVGLPGAAVLIFLHFKLIGVKDIQTSLLLTATCYGFLQYMIPSKSGELLNRLAKRHSFHVLGVAALLSIGLAFLYGYLYRNMPMRNEEEVARWTSFQFMGAVTVVMFFITP